jgi:hypothetical protein
VAPDLVLYTNVVDRWTTVREVMHLVERLAGIARKAHLIEATALREATHGESA